MAGWWRDNAGWVTLALTLVVCAIGFVMGVLPIEILGVFLLGLVLTTVNFIRRPGK